MNIVKSLHSSLLHRYFSYQGRHYFTVSVLWGFNLTSGEPVLEQELWETIGEMLGKNELFDAGMPKQNAELLVHGSCYSASHQAVEASRVSVSLGTISKELLVFGDRHWIQAMGIGWGVSDPIPFTQMPVSYANAFGGKEHAANPVGIGIDEVDLNGEPVIPVPNIEYADQLIGSPTDRPPPASLNRTDILSEQRLSNAGTYDQNYLETRMPGFPDDLNYDYFNDAAKDQWTEGFFNGDENFEIRNMSPDEAFIQGQLPGVYGRVFVNHAVQDEIEFKEIPTQLDTVWLFPAGQLGVLIHRGTLEVNEDDASDIKQILIANENKNDIPRPADHYKNHLGLRIDPEEGYKYLLNTAPLIPQDCRCGFKAMQENSVMPLELLAKANMTNYADIKKQEAEESFAQQIEAMKKQLQDSGMDPLKIDDLINQMTNAKNNQAELSPELQQITTIMEKVLPGITTDPNNLDLAKLNLKAMDELAAYTEKIQQQKKAEAAQKLNEQLDELKKAEAGPETSLAISSFEKAITEIELPPILPRIKVEEIIAQYRGQMDEMEKQLVVMQSMGLPESELAKMKSSFNIEEIEQKTREGLDMGNEGYRIGAHYIGRSRSPHAGSEDAIRVSLIAAFQSQGKTSHGDYAFVDLSNLDFTGIDLSGAYLEYADLTNTNLTNANLSKAILSHAIVKNTNFSYSNLTEANLGAINFDGCEFVNADLTGATLGKSKFSNSLFKHCKMAEKADMFLETEFDNASFIETDMRKNTFFDVDISDCDFSGSDLSGSSFVNPIMKNAIFSRANLNGVNFVKALAEGAKFDHASMINVRFVAESSLAGANFHSADVSKANMMGCNLQNAKFTESTLHESNFGGANLKYANFEKASAKESQFNKADLTFATLPRADFMEGSMHKAILSGAQFTGANLYGVNFLGCTIGDTDFAGANVEQTIFKDWKP
jgi:uncharacterized protein YjbI with pentapeptide repeats